MAHELFPQLSISKRTKVLKRIWRNQKLCTPYGDETLKDNHPKKFNTCGVKSHLGHFFASKIQKFYESGIIMLSEKW